MRKESPQLTFPGFWIPALPAGMTDFHFTVVPGRTPEPSRPGRADDSSAPLPPMSIDGFQSTETTAGSPFTTRNFKRNDVLGSVDI